MQFENPSGKYTAGPKQPWLKGPYWLLGFRAEGLGLAVNPKP